MSFLSKISPFQLIIFGTLAAIILSDNKSADELNVLGNLIVAIGSLMLTVAAQDQFLKTKQDNQDQKLDIQQQIQRLQMKIDKLEQKA